VSTPIRDDLEEVELELLLEGVYRHYGYDFRDYARSSLRRRIRERVRAEGLRTISGLKEVVLHDRAAMERLLLGLSVNVSAMFRDPAFFRELRRKVVPLLRTYPFIRIWHAGCSTGEEVYSMAILLHEEGLFERARIYATDMNETVLRQAREGTMPLAAMGQYTANYLQTGGREAFSNYYTANGNNAIIRPSLRKNVVFARHNLVTDRAFNEFHVIMCRNVLIYFNKDLQARVHALFRDSLVRLGFLCLGNKESLKHLPQDSSYREFDAGQRIYRRIA
jgi:chemotaxis protein methyltransferase CheR